MGGGVSRWLGWWCVLSGWVVALVRGGLLASLVTLPRTVFHQAGLALLASLVVCPADEKWRVGLRLVSGSR